MKRVLLLLVLGFCFLNMTILAQEKTQEKPKDNPYANANLTMKIIDAADSTFGYDILLDGKMLIHQPSVPAMPGNKGFKTKSDAEKTAELVINKIRNGEMPPTITVEELKKLKVVE
jgi:hypothetical protein